ncbi:MAG: hypothetical protein E7256_15535 [Lachnospiraceae bacterium]|nr:hypothetical protein [Lachnospiraceae bacterium]
MALGLLFVLFVVMIVLGIISTVLLFKVKNSNTSDVILVLMTAYSLLIAYLGANAEPTNFVVQQVMHWVIGFVAVAGTGVRFVTKKQSMLSKILVTISVAGGLYTLFLM